MTVKSCERVWLDLESYKIKDIKGFFWKLDKSENESIAGTTV